MKNTKLENADSWESSLRILRDEGIGRDLTHLDSRTSSVTTSWGVDWNETYIARDLMQNFFDANQEQLPQVQVIVEGTKVTISAPAKFELARLFYLGSEKGDGDIGQYGEGFKAAAVCLLRDHGIEPIAVSGDQIVYLRVDSEKIAGTELQPVVYYLLRSSENHDGARLILRGCSKNLIRALQDGLSHFFYEQNPLLGIKLWSSWDHDFAVYAAKTNVGHVFYHRLKRGEIPDIPVILVINKGYGRIEKKIKSDRDRNAFGGELMEVFYQIFARSGVKSDQAGQQAIVSVARNCWVRGHPLLKEIAEAGRYHNEWPLAKTKAVFGDQFYARSSTQDQAQALQYENWERAWREKGRQALPAYFSRFGVINAYAYGEELKRKAHEEAKARHNRLPTYAEQRSIKTLTDALRDFAPVIMKIFAKRTTSYSVAETEIILGELREKRNYQSREVFLSSAVFVADFAEALAIFLHEHSHIFGYDGSRGFTDALTELMETLVRERKNLDAYEVKWNEARERVEQERANEKNEEKITDLEADLELMDEQQLRDLVRRLPPTTVKRALKPE
jgi:hypothetical protein